MHPSQRALPGGAAELCLEAGKEGRNHRRRCTEEMNLQHGQAPQMAGHRLWSWGAVGKQGKVGWGQMMEDPGCIIVAFRAL